RVAPKSGPFAGLLCSSFSGTMRAMRVSRSRSSTVFPARNHALRRRVSRSWRIFTDGIFTLCHINVSHTRGDSELLLSRVYCSDRSTISEVSNESNPHSHLLYSFSFRAHDSSCCPDANFPHLRRPCQDHPPLPRPHADRSGRQDDLPRSRQAGEASGTSQGRPHFD